VYLNDQYQEIVSMQYNKPCKSIERLTSRHFFHDLSVAIDQPLTTRYSL